jgi:hypothetical protein
MIHGKPGHGYGAATSGTPGTPEFYAPLPRGLLPPREHYQARMALWLGVAALFFGVLTGVPAIVIGRRVQRYVVREPDRWLPSRKAEIAVVLGWVSVLGTTAVVAMVATDGWRTGSVGGGLALVGLLALAIGTRQNLPAPIARVTRTLRRAPLAVGLSLAGVLVGSLSGPLLTARNARMLAQHCTELRSVYAAHSKSGRFADAREAIAVLESDCKATDAELAAMRSDVAVKEADLKVRQADERKRQEADELALGMKLVEEERRREAAAEQKRGADRGGGAIYVVANDHMFLFDSAKSAKEASRIAARGSEAEFFEFVAEHGTAIERGTRVRRIESTWLLYLRVRDEGSGHDGWISSEFLRRE